LVAVHAAPSPSPTHIDFPASLLFTFESKFELPFLLAILVGVKLIYVENCTMHCKMGIICYLLIWRKICTKGSQPFLRIKGKDRFLVAPYKQERGQILCDKVQPGHVEQGR
jgi:hypothetical protein